MSLIDEFASQYGGLISYPEESFEEHVAIFIQNIASDLIPRHSRAGFNVEVGFVDARGFQALAHVRGDIGVVVFFKDCIDILARLARALFDDEVMFNALGQRNSFELLSSKQRDLIVNVGTQTLCKTSMVWLLLHELTHILHGHLGLLHEMAGIKHIAEVRGDSGVQGGLVRQTFEWDADLGADYLLLQLALNTNPDQNTSGDGRRWILPERGMLGTWEQGLFDVSIAVAIITGLFGESEKSLQESRTHPPEVLRAIYNIRGMAYMLSFRTGVPAQPAYDIATAAVLEYRRVLAAMENNSNLLIDQTELTSGIYDSHTAYEATCAKIWPDLQRFANGIEMPARYPPPHPELG